MVKFGAKMTNFGPKSLNILNFPSGKYPWTHKSIILAT